MRIGIDSSVLVAAMQVRHPLHAVARRWLVEHLGSDELWVTHHTLLECYAVLTGLPGQARITGDEARRLIDGTVRRRMKLACFEPESVWAIVDVLAAGNVIGGRSYDAFAAEVLRQSGVEAIATFNPGDFMAVARDLLIIDPTVPHDTSGC
jgi:predicted nucleic acid-binding protein